MTCFFCPHQDAEGGGSQSQGCHHCPPLLTTGPVSPSQCAWGTGWRRLQVHLPMYLSRRCNQAPHLHFSQSLQLTQASWPIWQPQDPYLCVLSVTTFSTFSDAFSSLPPQFLLCTRWNQGVCTNQERLGLLWWQIKHTHAHQPKILLVLTKQKFTSHLIFMVNIGWRGVCSIQSPREENWQRLQFPIKNSWK